MISYEISKELKEFGFKQVGVSKDYLPPFTSDVYMPTLSELIEEVMKHGVKFRLQWKNKWSEEEGKWQANIFFNKRFHFYTNGSTAEEAVAKLWIEVMKSNAPLEEEN